MQAVQDPLKRMQIKMANDDQKEEESIAIFERIMQCRYASISSEIPSVIDDSEIETFQNTMSALVTEYQQCDKKFAEQIAGFSVRHQFIFTQQRWAQQMKECQDAMIELQRAAHITGQCDEAPPTLTLRDTLKLPVGGYIESPISGKYYMNFGEAAPTLQGFICFAMEFHEGLIDATLSSKRPFATLITQASVSPQLAVKYYHKRSCDRGVTLSGLHIKERPCREMKTTFAVYENAVKLPVLRHPLFPWLPSPSKNVIRCHEYWETPQHDAYYMVMEYANCGELLNVMDHIHEVLNKEKRAVLSQIQSIEDDHQRMVNTNAYKEMLSIKADGVSPCIEIVRYIFQQMVQAVVTLHNQGVSHLDISLENFVVHFDDDGQFLVKLIDFGRAKKAKKKPNGESDPGPWPYEKFNFSVKTHPGKIRYSSAEGALFLKYQDADPYDASKEDVFALGVCLYTMLTADMPWNTPFFLEPDESNPIFGYLNGSKKRKIDLRTMRDAESGLEIGEHLIDPMFHHFQTAQGVCDVVHGSCYIDYFSEDSLDLLYHIFNSRIPLKDLVQHPFVCKNPNPELRQQVINQYATYRAEEFQKDQEYAQNSMQTWSSLDDEWIPIKAAKMVVNMRTEEQTKALRTKNQLLRAANQSGAGSKQEESKSVFPSNRGLSVHHPSHWNKSWTFRVSKDRDISMDVPELPYDCDPDELSPSPMSPCSLKRIAQPRNESNSALFPNYGNKRSEETSLFRE